jgi:ubiquinone/menaquinone biosynthesis C-methylase UbiE
VPSAGGPDGAQDEHFERLASRYDELRAAEYAGGDLLDVLVEVGRLDQGRVLDIGCGTGRAAEALARRGARVWGVDRSAAMLAEARRREIPGGGFKRADAERLPFRDGWFDAALMRQVVHHIERAAAFAEARRVLRPGGRLAIATFHPAHFDTIWVARLFPRVAEIDRARFPDEPTLRADLAGAGFGAVVSRRLTERHPLTRDEAVARLRGRFISTLSLLADDELADGIARAGHELPERFEARLEWLVLAAERP